MGNVHFSTNREELKEFFKECGNVTRVTLLSDRYTGMRKGFAYIEFEDEESLQKALILDDTLFKGRKVKILPKRANTPGVRGRRRMRRGFIGFRSRGHYRPY